MNNTYINYKNELKELMNALRETKHLRKEAAACSSPNLYSLESELLSLKREFRIIHIAMSLYRGHTIEQIEPNPSKFKKNIRDAYKKKIDSIISELKEGEIENV